MSANVTICTPLRDAAGYLNTYRAQIARLDWPAERLRVVICEGDSGDDTVARLRQWTLEDARVKVVFRYTGVKHYSSIVHPERFALLARVFNAALAAVDYAWTDYVLFLPGDIRYGPELLRRLVAHGVDIVAPLVFQADIFYDIWAFSRAGVDFPPFRQAETAELYGTALLPMTTVGGTVLLAAAVLRAGCRYTTERVDRGLCETARAQGFGVWADPVLWVEHPRRS